MLMDLSHYWDKMKITSEVLCLQECNEIHILISYKRREQEKKENWTGSSYKSPLHKGKKKISKKPPVNCISSTYPIFQVPKTTA